MKYRAEVTTDSEDRLSMLKVFRGRDSVTLDFEYDSDTGILESIDFKGKRDLFPSISEVIDMITTKMSVKVDLISKVRGLEWFDRTPTPIWKTYSANAVDSHAITERWSYTVPDGKKAILEFAYFYVRRAAPPTVSGYIIPQLRFTPNDGSENVLDRMVFRSATEYDIKEKNLAVAIILSKGDKVRGLTIDTSTGGQTDIIFNAKFTEFDV